MLKQSFSLLHASRVKLDRKWNYRNVISPYYRLYFIDEGEGVVSGAGHELKLEAGFMYLVPSFTLCSLYCEEYLSQFFIQFFEESPDGASLFQHHRAPMKVQASPADSALFQRMLAINPGRGISGSDDPRAYEKSVYYRQCQELNNHQSTAAFLETQGIILQLLSRFLDAVDQYQPAERIPLKVLEAMRYIQLHLDQPVTIAQLAGRANLHPDYFSRRFLEHTGERPLAYLHTKRIERAQYLIASTELPYAQIAAETGFDNLPHFSRVFKKITGFTPGQYRKQDFR
ncbi:helix-turn-helix domain-containing protein [Chitinophaga sp. GCM10012297]|uniref:Helix-turn-helix transcriptional regulator n=1 Tax=Chitinophaga chungangae TaxID=2821488 RepID=A0ABS3YG13_9BACT|nr:AraC family transcriptional regulator [Chitinophaga chungangae]MBO9153615.1 helix-turn-helix transcriptional regulator [Chitinophaga chungangae]